MRLPGMLWRLAAPYDAYISHVSRLCRAVERIRALTDRALGYETGLLASVRLVPGEQDAAARAERFRSRLAAAGEMSDAELDDLLAHLGGGTAATVEQDRAAVAARLGAVSRAIEAAFAEAVAALRLLEERGYDPRRPDVARQLRANRLPSRTTEEFRAELRVLGRLVGKRLAEGR
ncbi:hypothetical protein HRbin29_01812 [bacterium HR29]|jgi:hypothetical protein|nr:hypothetical protein HRbin29_01812 [bacterium HR29]